jgi:hypothetical protein
MQKRRQRAARLRRANGLAIHRTALSDSGEYGNRHRLDSASSPIFFSMLQNGLATIECR